jgi:hypothetical protein
VSVPRLQNSQTPSVEFVDMVGVVAVETWHNAMLNHCLKYKEEHLIVIVDDKVIVSIE